MKLLVQHIHDHGKAEKAADLISAKQDAIADVVNRGFPEDDIKKASGAIYNAAKQILLLKQVGNDAPAFARNTLSKLIRPGMAVYSDLKADIFGR